MLRPDTIDVSKRDLHLFFTRDNDVCNTSHTGLPLPLFVFGFFLVDNIKSPFAADQNVIRADFFDACADFHQSLP